MSCQCSPPPLAFNVFRGYRKRPVTWNGLLNTMEKILSLLSTYFFLSLTFNPYTQTREGNVRKILPSQNNIESYCVQMFPNLHWKVAEDLGLLPFSFQRRIQNPTLSSVVIVNFEHISHLDRNYSGWVEINLTCTVKNRGIKNNLSHIYDRAFCKNS